jgi:putative oxidoreductase
MDLKPAALTALRIVAGILFFSHGAQKLFGWFGGMGPGGGTADLWTRFGMAGLIEVVAGAGIALGVATRPLAFLASGEMAAAYFWAHTAGRGSIWWWRNGGELAMLYCFVWLYFAAAGAGRFSVDSWWAARRPGGR